jgi:hypothetical protein
MVRPRAAAPATIREAEIGPRPTAWRAHWPALSVSDSVRRCCVRRLALGRDSGKVSNALEHGRKARRLDREVRGRRVRRVSLIATLASEYLIASLRAWTSVVSMFSDPGGQPRLPLPFRIAPFALVIIGTITVRVMRRTGAAEGPPVGDTTPDSCWFVGGHLYFNRADPTLFVEKRTGLGYTLNLANPASLPGAGCLCGGAVDSVTTRGVVSGQYKRQIDRHVDAAIVNTCMIRTPR